MESNKELELAWEYAEYTGVSIFLTGKAGTGKTTFLRQLRERSAKSMVVVAPTGVAAINAGGVTIHSFFQLPLSPYVPGSDYQDKFNFSKDKLRILRSIDLLVIDEISMVRSDLLDAIDNALRKYRRCSKPFGGVQLLMIGDLQQLAPVVTPQDEILLRPYYSTPYFFGSHALAQINYVTIELAKIYRQQNEQFVKLLNNVRDNCVNKSDLALLQSRLNPTFRPEANSGYIRLTTHNATADNYNNEELARIKQPICRYRAAVKGTFPEYSYPTAESLELKIGAQVMFIKNDPSSEKRYYNGKIGHVVYADPQMVKVQCPGDSEPIDVTPQVWENAKYTVNEETNKVETEVQGTFAQMPLRLAWAITIHKSQGLTFDKVIIDAGAAFAPGQVYVALSRCKTLEGIVLATSIGTAQMGGDPMVDSYIANQGVAAAQSVAQLPAIKRDYYRHLLVDMFDFSDVVTLQTGLTRQLSQVYRHTFPNETLQQQNIELSLREQVIAVADKWIAMLSTLPYEQLVDAAFQARVGNSAIYFKNQLVEIFGTSLHDAAKVRTDNKKANQRVSDLLADLRQTLDKNVFLLTEIAKIGFSVSNYLQSKQRAVLESSSEMKAKRVRERRKAEKEKEKKTRKERAPKSHVLSYEMFRQGMTRDEIAKERLLTVSTITSHLIRYIDSGQLTLADVFSPIHINAVKSVMAQLSGNCTFHDLRSKLPATISDNDIVNIFARLRRAADKGGNE